MRIFRYPSSSPPYLVIFQIIKAIMKNEQTGRQSGGQGFLVNGLKEMVPESG